MPDQDRKPNGMERAVEAAGTQALLAESVGATQQYISQCVTKGWTSLRVAHLIERRYGIPLADLVRPLDAEGQLAALNPAN